MKKSLGINKHGKYWYITEGVLLFISEDIYYRLLLSFNWVIKKNSKKGVLLCEK